MATDFGMLRMDDAIDAVVVTTPDGIVESWSAGGPASFGFDAAAAVGKPLAAVVPPRLLAQAVQVLVGGADGRFEHVVWRMGQQDGESTPTFGAGRFLAAMSHELRTPLNAIIGFAGTLLMKLPGPLNEGQDKQIRTIQSSARHLLGLINDLMDLSRLESGQVDTCIERLNCQDILQEVAATIGPLARAKGLQFTVEDAAAPLYALSDRRLLVHILTAIADNAVKFTSAGEVKLQLAERGAHGLAFDVCDTGSGIDPAVQEKLFKAFAQFDSGQSGRQAGAGLGLYLARKLAFVLGAKIVFESQRGVGSVFSLVLPAAAA